jgi:hypothetical protein
MSNIPNEPRSSLLPARRWRAEPTVRARHQVKQPDSRSWQEVEDLKFRTRRQYEAGQFPVVEQGKCEANDWRTLPLHRWSGKRLPLQALLAIIENDPRADSLATKCGRTAIGFEADSEEGMRAAACLGLTPDIAISKSPRGHRWLIVNAEPEVNTGQVRCKQCRRADKQCAKCEGKRYRTTSAGFVGFGGLGSRRFGKLEYEGDGSLLTIYGPRYEIVETGNSLIGNIVQLPEDALHEISRALLTYWGGSRMMLGGGRVKHGPWQGPLPKVSWAETDDDVIVNPKPKAKQPKQVKNVEPEHPDGS